MPRYEQSDEVRPCWLPARPDERGVAVHAAHVDVDVRVVEQEADEAVVVAWEKRKIELAALTYK